MSAYLINNVYMMLLVVIRSKVCYANIRYLKVYVMMFHYYMLNMIYDVYTILYIRVFT